MPQACGERRSRAFSARCGSHALLSRKPADDRADTRCLPRHRARGRRGARPRPPVVALESTIITHGMPYPENVETARAVEASRPRHGAVPATIAMLRRRGPGRPCPDAEIERLGRSGDVLKLSRADLPLRRRGRADGATTVAATMICAHLAGIRVFATGGIGGVHRGAETSFDVSADLDELARTPVAVVCAGAKAILDLPRTLEVLETRGVPVIGYRTDALPGLLEPRQRPSGADPPRHARGDRAADATKAALGPRRRRSDRQSGAGRGRAPVRGDAARSRRRSPPPRPRAAGKAMTPYLLAQVAARTGGRSLATSN